MNLESAKQIVASEYKKNGWIVFEKQPNYHLVVKRGDNEIRNIIIRRTKLHIPGPEWESLLFEKTSWSLIHVDRYKNNTDPNDRLVFVLFDAFDDGVEKYNGDLFIFRVNEFNQFLQASRASGSDRAFYISKHQQDWFVRKNGIGKNAINPIQNFCTSVTNNRRNFN